MSDEITPKDVVKLLEITPKDVVKLLELIAVDSKSSCRRFRILRCLIKKCFIRKPYFLDTFVSIGGPEALVNIAHSSRESSKRCGDSIIKLLHEVCCNLEEPLHGIYLMIRLCELLKEEDEMLYRCQLFISMNAKIWVGNDKQTCLQIVTGLLVSVHSALTKHLENPEMNHSGFRHYPLKSFSNEFDLIGEELKENMVIKKLCDSIMELMDEILSKHSKVATYNMNDYCVILGIVCSVEMYSRRLQKFHEVLARRVDEFHNLVLMCLEFYGNSWLETNAWAIRYMGLELKDKVRYAHAILPQINNEVEFSLCINRSKILEDSKRYLKNAQLNQLRGFLKVKFIGESGEGDGPVREWFLLFIEEMLHHKFFISCSTDKRKILPTRDPIDDICIFTAAGKVIAMSLMHRVHLGIKLAKMVHASFAERDFSIEDVRDTDPQLYVSWMQYIERGSAGIVAEDESYDPDLVPDSFDEFVGSLRVQLLALKIGFDYVTGIDWRVNFFRAMEPEVVDAFLLGDSKEICMDDWKSHTDTEGCCEKDPRISWFWKVLNDLSSEDARNFLFFWTAVKYLPPQGFGGLPKRLKLTLALIGEKDRLPTSSTCFYKLNLPLYSSYDVLERCLLWIARERFEFDLE